MDRKALLLTLLVALVVSACTKSLGTWTKQNMTELQHARDQYACAQETKFPVTIGIRGIVNTERKIDPAMYGRCMKARGYLAQ